MGTMGNGDIVWSVENDKGGWYSELTLVAPVSPAKLAEFPEDLTWDSVSHDMLACVLRYFPTAGTHRAPCPECVKRSWLKEAPVSGVIIHLNDDHLWPRERIADWLDTLSCDLSISEEEPCRTRPLPPDPAAVTPASEKAERELDELAQKILASLTQPMLPEDFLDLLTIS